MVELVKLYRLTQNFSRPQIKDISGKTAQELAVLSLNKKIQPGQKIGITVGSRGIQNLIPILQTAVNYIKTLGATPYLIAAMGSHGGGTAQGQKDLLDSLGITEDTLGAEVVTCSDCEPIAHTPNGLPVFIVNSALAMDGILIINRVKTHTSFKGIVESGLIKKLVVGLGGPKGAKQFHGFGPGELARLLVEIGNVILSKLPVLGGLAIIESAYEETAAIKAVTVQGMVKQESDLLIYSKSLMSSLPVDDIDLLIIEEMGKNYSGTGIDTNIIGRARIQGVIEPEKPKIKRIAVLDLSEESHGNATGIGMADFVTKRLVDKIDRQTTYLNCLTSTFVTRAAIPMYFDTEKELVEAALYSLSGISPEKLRIVIIPNTLFLTECFVSETIAAELTGKASIKLETEPQTLTFDPDDNINLRI
ncbi:hypothetical protein Ga0466249_004887 [Sporomusaceae bacterium BoRhaA]|uniref:hypothetical protein n=1 Tax=Pelorhabdus rhamnosifermentans TaxID=2772457 RepID=UPI001C0621BF|nr:hypothetical protein [Pelorhabdus rhamnosifermentans]MBU2703739.1 hypothetical protein [Pelorhabdus rhamnosifermentans]